MDYKQIASIWSNDNLKFDLNDSYALIYGGACITKYKSHFLIRLWPPANKCSIVSILHEIGHFIDFNRRGPDSMIITTKMSTKQLREVKAWKFAFELYCNTYQFENLNAFFDDLYISLISYHISQKRINMIINGLKNRIENPNTLTLTKAA